MFVYRVENENNSGPYTGKKNYEWAVVDHNTIERPCLNTDGFFEHQMKGIDVFKLHFGFETKEQLNKWFLTDEIKNLYKEKFKIKKFDAKWAIEGKSKKQLMFDRKNSTLVKTYNLDEWVSSENNDSGYTYFTKSDEEK